MRPDADGVTIGFGSAGLGVSLPFSAIMSLHEFPSILARRSRVDLALGLTIAALVGVLNFCANFLEEFRALLGLTESERIVNLLVNVLFVWLVGLLALSFHRWRRAEHIREDLATVIDGINPDTLLVVTRDRTISLTNPTVQPMFGYQPEEVLGRRTEMLYLDRRIDPNRPHEVCEALDRRGFHLGAATGTRRDGSHFPMEIITGELANNQGAVLLLRDTSDRVREETRRRQMEEQVRQRQHLESLGVLAGGVAHDFNNILTGVLGNADLALAFPTTPPEVRRHLQDIVTSAQRAAVICRDLLMYAGKGRLQFLPLDLSTAVRDVWPSLEAIAPPHIDLQSALAEVLPSVRGDIHQVRQVVITLVNNAIEALGSNPGSLRVTTGRRECTAEFLQTVYGSTHAEPGTYAFIEVADTGEGMDSETLGKIFDPFFSTKFPGRGLGLATALGVVRGHHGALDVRSNPTTGSAFTILLPAERKPAGTAPAPVAA